MVSVHDGCIPLFGIVYKLMKSGYAAFASLGRSQSGPNRETNSPSLTSKLMSDKTTVRFPGATFTFHKDTQIHSSCCVWK